MIINWFMSLYQKYNALCFNDKITLLSFLSALVGAFFAFYKWRKDIALKRANYVNELTEKVRTDPTITDCLHEFDYGFSHMLDENYEPWYGAHFHDNMEDDNEFEKKIDKTLAFLSYICYLRKQGIISKKDIKFFDYALLRTLQNFEVQDYLYNLYHFAKAIGTTPSFLYLIQYGTKKKLMYNGFKNPKTCEKDSPVFHKYLNF